MKATTEQPGQSHEVSPDHLAAVVFSVDVSIMGCAAGEGEGGGCVCVGGNLVTVSDQNESFAIFRFGGTRRVDPHWLVSAD